MKKRKQQQEPICVFDRGEKICDAVKRDPPLNATPGFQKWLSEQMREGYAVAYMRTPRFGEATLKASSIRHSSAAIDFVWSDLPFDVTLYKVQIFDSEGDVLSEWSERSIFVDKGADFTLHWSFA